MGNIGWTELLVIVLAVLVLFGAKRVPELGKSIGKGIREFKKALSTDEEEKQSAEETTAK